MRRRGFGVVAAAVLVAAVLAGHRLIPDVGGSPGSIVETFLPWLGLSVPVLAALGWWRRPRVALPAVLLPLIAWLGLFGPVLLPDNAGQGLVAVQHNVSDENRDPAGTVRELLRVSPDLVALSEVLPEALPAYDAAFGTAYPHRVVHGTVALWSRYPVAEEGALDIRPRAFGPDWNRGLRAVVRTPYGDVAVYVAHLPSVRMGVKGFAATPRDESAARLGEALGAEPLGRVLLLGDLNGTVDDRGLKPVTARLSTAPAFAFSWPARAPVARIDQILGRGLTVTSLWSLPRTGSDHLPIAARITF
ncbi:endonuclease/exonuclease/phosphatase family protein [Couchioplanes caeruleus]|uniref:endonuclease/exonuclease/phosphatase family protein n=1 Tax=Couchioplanes caeruleus TaxID=56438 RepID=UPI0020BE64A9|nr:endonuclease/exonuclease/phosphatase family protein [Couchioplanes caeruleus]UQU65305.1 endonuclease/exonuclease/phosphatase family protein [Couchioplanes caeruleus]